MAMTHHSVFICWGIKTRLVMTYFSKQNQREFFPVLKSSAFILVEVEIWIQGFHLLPIGLLHDSLSDEIGYKTVTFAGYEHSFQAPYRLQEWGRRRAGGGKFYPNFRHRRAEIDLSITGEVVFSPFLTFFHVLECSCLPLKYRPREVSAEAPKWHILHLLPFKSHCCKTACYISVFIVVFFS